YLKINNGIFQVFMIINVNAIIHTKGELCNKHVAPKKYGETTFSRLGLKRRRKV
ncbi:hypothetical protein DSO57_1038904, partial [Entomophthora muscae]